MDARVLAQWQSLTFPQEGGLFIKVKSAGGKGTQYLTPGRDYQQVLRVLLTLLFFVINIA